jgi:signal transduction histidine kinase
MKRLFVRTLLDRISLEAKSRLMLVLMILAILAAGGLSHLLFFTLKHDYEALYSQHTLPVIQLEWIKEAYAINVLDTLRDMEQGWLEIDQAQEVTTLARSLIDRHWQTYLAASYAPKPGGLLGWLHRLSLQLWGNPDQTVLDQDQLKKQTARRIDRVDGLLEAIFDRHRTGEHQRAITLTSDALYPAIKSAETHLGQLISRHLQSATAQREQTERIYQMSTRILFALVAAIVIFTLWLTLIIIGSIRTLHDQLESEVENKTRALRDLNAQLGKRIEREVKSSQEKDRIMYQQSRMAAMGEMIANIAHQWRQPLNALSLLIQSFGTKYDRGTLDGPFVHKQVASGLRIASQMSETIENFRNFFHPNREAQMFNLQLATREAVGLIEAYLAQDHIRITLHERGELCLEGFSNEYAQVLLNLINNARDALIAHKPHDRQIAIYIAAAAQDSQMAAQIQVIDNGGGVPEAIIDRIFEPYFTTKHKAQGTGIGLYMSKQIVEQQMGGALGVKNIWHKMDGQKMQRCALFSITLPAAKRRDCGSKATRSSDTALCGRRSGCP